MFERALAQILKDHVPEFLADEPRVRAFFEGHMRLAEAEIDAIIAYFDAHPIDVIHEYPRNVDSGFPLIAVVLGNERETQNYTGDFAGMLTAEEAEELGDPTLVGADITGAVWTHTVHLWVCVDQNPDMCLFLYQIVKYVMSAARIRAHDEDADRVTLIDSSLTNVTLSGTTLSPNEQYLPANIFVRILRAQITLPFEAVGSRTTRATGVIGVHVSDDGDGEQVGVRADITVTAGRD